MLTTEIINTITKAASKEIIAINPLFVMGDFLVKPKPTRIPKIHIKINTIKDINTNVPIVIGYNVFNISITSSK